jgi:hypothetical protein
MPASDVFEAQEMAWALLHTAMMLAISEAISEAEVVAEMVAAFYSKRR